MGLSAHWPGGDALNAAAAETISLLALLGVLAWAGSRPRGWPEAAASVPAAVILIAAGAIRAGRAGAEARQLGPVTGPGPLLAWPPFPRSHITLPRRHITLPRPVSEPAKPGHGARLLVASPSPNVAKR